MLKVGYSNDAKKQRDTLGKHGYKRDEELSNDKRQVYYNPEKKHLLANVNGTQNNIQHFLQDWGTNAAIALGQGEKTDRFKEENNNLEKAKKKYNPEKTTLTGHSQGGFHASHIAGKTDEIVTYNKAHDYGSISNKEHHYRVQGDPVSIFASGTKHSTNVAPQLGKSQTPIIFNGLAQHFATALDRHSLKHIENKPIYV